MLLLALRTMRQTTKMRPSMAMTQAESLSSVQPVSAQRERAEERHGAGHRAKSQIKRRAALCAQSTHCWWRTMPTR